MVLTLLSAYVAVTVSRASDWDPLTLFWLLLGVAIVSEAFRLQSRNLNISAAFLAVVLAMTLLGPTPAAVLGVTTILANALKLRAPLRATLANVSTFAFFPLVGGLLFRAMGGPTLLHGDVAPFVLLVLVVFLSMNVLNFFLIAIDIAVVDGQSIPVSCSRRGSRSRISRRTLPSSDCLRSWV
jgi:hypothetical protein